MTEAGVTIPGRARALESEQGMNPGFATLIHLSTTIVIGITMGTSANIITPIITTTTTITPIITTTPITTITTTIAMITIYPWLSIYYLPDTVLSGF